MKMNKQKALTECPECKDRELFSTVMYDCFGILQKMYFNIPFKSDMGDDREHWLATLKAKIPVLCSNCIDETHFWYYPRTGKTYPKE